MKTSISLFLLFFRWSLFAQDYQCLQYGPHNYFINSNGYVRGIRVDSVRYEGSDIVYFPYHTQRISNYLSTIKVDTFGGSWLGKNVVQHSDGAIVFDNLWDTVVIKTQAHTGDTWVFFDDTTSRHYMATVSNEDTMTVDGTIDSVKTITIKAYSSGSPNPSDPVNNFQIILSKSHGFVQTCDLYTFPYRRPSTDVYSNFDYYLDVLLGNLGGGDLGYHNSPPTFSNSIFKRFDLHNPTMQEVYDFAAGDVFESMWVHTDNSRSEYERCKTDSIAAVTKSLYRTTYTIVTREMNKVTNYDVTTTVTVSYKEPVIDTRVYDTTTLINRKTMPEEGYLLSYYQHEPVNNSYCDTVPSYVFNYDYKGGGFWYNGAGMIQYYAYDKYSPGFGMTMSESYNPPNDGKETTSYLYYSKGGKICGTYVFPGTNGVQPIISKQSITIAPNPATDHINITASKQYGADAFIAVYDLSGRKVYQAIPEQLNELSINTSSWPGGIYMFIIQSGAESQREKVIINR